MANGTGPALSLSASGTLAGVLQFRRRPGGAVACLPTSLRGYDGANSIARRALFSLLCRGWKILNVSQKSDWDSLHTYELGSGREKFFSENLKRWTRYLMPAILYPPDAPGNANTPIVNATNKNGSNIRIRYGTTAVTTSWLVMLHHSLTNNFTPNRSTLIDGRTLIPAGTDWRLLGNFAPGIHRFKVVCTSFGGIDKLNSGQTSITIP
jgi:hypothetical protein